MDGAANSRALFLPLDLRRQDYRSTYRRGESNSEGTSSLKVVRNNADCGDVGDANCYAHTKSLSEKQLDRTEIK